MQHCGLYETARAHTLIYIHSSQVCVVYTFGVSDETAAALMDLSNASPGASTVGFGLGQTLVEPLTHNHALTHVHAQKLCSGATLGEVLSGSY